MSLPADDNPPEMSLIIKLRDIDDTKQKQRLDADAMQREALARRFDLPSIERLGAVYQLEPGDDGIRLYGTIKADLHQSCATTGDPFPVAVEEGFDILFMPAGSQRGEEEEIELAAEDCDIVEYENGKLDIGEAIAQTFYLALDPYARSPDAEKIGKERGLKDEGEAGPFGALAALRDKMQK